MSERWLTGTETEAPAVGAVSAFIALVAVIAIIAGLVVGHLSTVSQPPRMPGDPIEFGLGSWLFWGGALVLLLRWLARDAVNRLVALCLVGWWVS